MSATAVEETTSGEVRSNPKIEKRNAQFREAIEGHGVENTLKLVERYVSALVSIGNTHEEAMKHPAFQYLERKKQYAIYRGETAEEMTELHDFLRLLLCTCAAMHGVRPLHRESEFIRWTAVIRNIRDERRPKPKPLVADRKTLEAQREGRRRERSQVGARYSGKGGKS